MNGPEAFERPAERLPQWQADRLATLLDALDGVPVSDAERRTLTWLCGFEAHTVEHLAAVIRRARARSATLATRAVRDEAVMADDQLITKLAAWRADIGAAPIPEPGENLGGRP